MQCLACAVLAVHSSSEEAPVPLGTRQKGPTNEAKTSAASSQSGTAHVHRQSVLNTIREIAEAIVAVNLRARKRGGGAGEGGGAWVGKHDQRIKSRCGFASSEYVCKMSRHGS